jgi:cyanophycinase-like exopeptidase
VQSVYARGGGVGGTSAGLAIQGDFTYDGCTGSAVSSDALANPYHRTISFTYDFFHWANMAATLTDDHFVVRDRMGRTLAFLARQIQDGRAASALGVAVNEATSLEVDKNGRATVVGNGPAYFILADHAPQVCQPGQALTYSGFKIWKVPAGGTFDLRNRPANGYYLRSVNAGVIDADPY